MAVIGTFSQFTTARLALYASQASLSVTGNNIANINTEGYTRQRMDLVSLYSTGQGKYANIFNTNVGYGVLTRGATQLRDPYLDIRYRNENTKLGANDEKADGLYQIGHILDEVGKGTDQLEGFGVIEAQFGVFFQSLQDLKTNIGSEEYDDLVRSAASTLTAYFRKAASDLQDIKTNKVGELNDALSDINSLLNSIRDLNSQIRTQGIYGDKALELRDARNLALDKLSSYIPIDVTYSMERIDQFSEVEKLTVTIKGSKGPDGQPIKLVDGIYGGQITMPEKMAVLNENYDPQAIIDAVNKAKEDAKTAELWTAAGNADKWTEYNLADAIQTARDGAEERVRRANPNMTEAELEPLITAEQDNVEEQVIRRAMTEEAEKTAMADAEAAYGKYVVDPDDPSKGFTNDWDTAAANGYYNYDPTDPINDNALYLMRVEQLVDQKGRVMDDKKDPSGKSQAIALNDVTFCAKSADAAIDETRVDSNALGSLQALREMLIRKGEYSSEEDIARDNYATIKRGIPYYERALDNLAKKFAEVFNECNQLPVETVYKLAGDGEYMTDINQNPAFLDEDGNTIPAKDANGNVIPGLYLTLDMLTEVVKDENGDPVMTEDGQIVRRQLTTPDAVRYLEQLRQEAGKAPGYSFYDGGVLISNRGDNNDPNGITAANISISHAWSNHTVRLLNTTEKSQVDESGVESSHSTRRDNIANMISQFDAKRDYFAKDAWPDAEADLPIFHGSFREVFTAISGTLADDQLATNGKLENYTISTLNLDNDRQSVSGVDLNEEATSMMQFSKSYSAACRLLTTIDSMLDTLINGTAR